MNDVSDWEVVDTSSGTREGYWVQNLRTPVRRKALVKLPKKRQSFTCGEVWAEFLAASIGKKLDLEVPDVEIVQYGDNIAALIWDFLPPSYGLRSGTDIANSSRGDRRLSLYEIHDAIADRMDQGIAKLFVSHMICFDILIGNPDRHQENWGIMVPDKIGGSIMLAPYYDNGSGFGSNLDPGTLRAKLALPWDGFDRGFRYEIVIRDQCRPHIRDLLKELRGWNIGLKEFRGKLVDLTPNIIDRLVHDIPDEVISEDQRQFAAGLLLHRRDLLLSADGGFI